MRRATTRQAFRFILALVGGWPDVYHFDEWNQIGTPGVNNFNPGDSSIDAIAVAPGTNKVVYVSAGGIMFVTRNAQAGGASVTWTQINLPSGAAGARNSLAVDPSDSTGGTAYAVVNAFTGGGKHVYKTTNESLQTAQTTSVTVAELQFTTLSSLLALSGINLDTAVSDLALLLTLEAQLF
jgi:hypothetical protein